jgi:hypothetical protein
MGEITMNGWLERRRRRRGKRPWQTGPTTFYLCPSRFSFFL